MSSRKNKIGEGQQGIVHLVDFFLQQADVLLAEGGQLEGFTALVGSDKGFSREKPVLDLEQDAFVMAVNVLVTQQANKGVQLVDGAIGLDTLVVFGYSFPTQEGGLSFIASLRVYFPLFHSYNILT